MYFLSHKKPIIEALSQAGLKFDADKTICIVQKVSVGTFFKGGDGRIWKQKQKITHKGLVNCWVLLQSLVTFS